MKTKNVVICIAVIISLLLCGCSAGKNTAPEALVKAEKLLEQGMYEAAAAAFAENAGRYQSAAQPMTEVSLTEDAVYVGGMVLTSGQYLANGASAPSDSKPNNTGYVHFENQTLTMHDAVIVSGTFNFYAYDELQEFEAAIYSGRSLTIILEGNNFAIGRDTTLEASVGVFVSGVNGDETLSISGNGSLSATGGAANGDYGSSAGIVSVGNLEISGNVVINAVAASLSDDSEGMSTGLFSDEGITISENAKVTAVSGSIGEYGEFSSGLATDGDLIIDSSTVIAVTLSQAGDTCALLPAPELMNVSIVEASMNSDGTDPVSFDEDDYYYYKYIKIA